MNPVYTERPTPYAARMAWDYFIKAYGKPPIYMFFSPKADFADSRGAGWTAYYGERIYTSTWGAMGASIFYTQSPDMIRYVMSRDLTV